MKFFLTIAGILLILEGVPWFMSPGGVRRLLGQLATLPDGALRLLGLTSMLIGLLMVYLAT